MQKLVDGVLVNMTPQEIAAREAEQAAALTANITAHLAAYRYAKEISPLPYNGFTEDGTEEHRRNAKETIDFLREAGEAAPATIPWNSPNHGVQVITLETLVGWLMAVGQRRFVCFAVQTALLPALGSFTKTAELEQAFDAAYAAEVGGGE